MNRWKGIKTALPVLGVLLIFCGCAAPQGQKEPVATGSLAGTVGAPQSGAPESGAQSGQEGGLQSGPESIPDRACKKIERIALLEGGQENPAGALQSACSGMMVRIAAGNLLGSGVIFSDDGREVLIATAGHVLDRVKDTGGEAAIEFRDGFEVKTSEYSLAEGTDLALLRVPRESLLETAQDGRVIDHGEEYFCCAADQAAYDAILIGDPVIAMGSYTGVAQDAYGGRLTADYTYSQDFGAYMMLAQVPTKPGMSGGGLFDEQGHLLGILCGASQDGEVAAAPLIALLSMIEEETDQVREEKLKEILGDGDVTILLSLTP